MMPTFGFLASSQGVSELTVAGDGASGLTCAHMQLYICRRMHTSHSCSCMRDIHSLVRFQDGWLVGVAGLLVGFPIDIWCRSYVAVCGGVLCSCMR